MSSRKRSGGERKFVMVSTAALLIALVLFACSASMVEGGKKKHESTIVIAVGRGKHPVNVVLSGRGKKDKKNGGYGNIIVQTGRR